MMAKYATPFPRPAPPPSRRARLRRPRLPLQERRDPRGGADPLRHPRRSRGKARAHPPRHRRLVEAVSERPLRGRPFQGRGRARRADALHRHPRQRRARAVVQAERRPARALPALRLRRHGRAPAPPPRRRPAPPSRSPRHGHVDGRHADVDVGRALADVHGRAPAAGQRAGADRGAQPRLAEDGHRRPEARRRRRRRAAPDDRDLEPAAVAEERADARRRRPLARRADEEAAGEYRRRRPPLRPRSVAQLRPRAGAREHRRAAHRHQLRRRLRQPAGARHPRARDQARQARALRPHPHERGHARARHSHVGGAVAAIRQGARYTTALMCIPAPTEAKTTTSPLLISCGGSFPFVIRSSSGGTVATELLPSQEIVIGITSSCGALSIPYSLYSASRMASSILPLAWWISTFLTSPIERPARSSVSLIAPATLLSAYL